MNLLSFIFDVNALKKLVDWRTLLWSIILVLAFCLVVWVLGVFNATVLLYLCYFGIFCILVAGVYTFLTWKR